MQGRVEDKDLVANWERETAQFAISAGATKQIKCSGGQFVLGLTKQKFTCKVLIKRIVRDVISKETIRSSLTVWCTQTTKELGQMVWGGAQTLHVQQAPL